MRWAIVALPFAVVLWIIYFRYSWENQIKLVQEHSGALYVGMQESEVHSLIGKPFRIHWGPECINKKGYKLDTSLASCKEKRVAFPYDPPEDKVLALRIDLRSNQVTEIEIVSYLNEFD